MGLIWDGANPILPPSSTGGASHTSGTLASRSGSPSVGDTHYATDFSVRLVCNVAGAWSYEHGGPLAVTRGPIPSGAGNWIAAAASDGAGPVGGPGYSIVLGLHVNSLPGGTERCLAENFSTVGWLLGVSKGGGTANRFYLLNAGMSSDAKVELGDMVTGSLTIALTVTTTAIRWSINGAAVGGGGAGSAGGTVAISGAYSPPTSGARFVLGNNHAGDFAFTTGDYAHFGVYTPVLSDAALAAASAAHAAYLPASLGVTPVASWLAGQSPRPEVYQELRGTQGASLAMNPASMGWTAR